MDLMQKNMLYAYLWIAFDERRKQGNDLDGLAESHLIS
jgi:hypothetical protein